MASTAPHPLVRLEHVSKTFATHRGTVTACDDVSLTVDKGRSLGVVGESGSGKSTLVRILLMLLPPTSGRVWLNGVDVTNLSERRLKPYRRHVQFVAQDPLAALMPNLTVAENIAEPLAIHGVGDKVSRRETTLALMEKVGLPHALCNSLPSELSGGQQQRVAIARALALMPELIVLDEAVSSLDVSIQAQILNLLQALKENMQLTYVFISHNLAVIRLMCEQTAVMYKGKIIEYGESEALFARPLHPYTQALLDAIPAFTKEGVTPLRVGGKRGVESGRLTVSGCLYHPRCPFASELCRQERPSLRLIGDRQVACHHAERVHDLRLAAGEHG
ncbi:MAG: ATP-binding cassette domain-containing protein [Alicyclobacillus herbarius]|uniref:oligopeptide/dipeptide ABC transporter ATP-binding protein n=1 Tax=Alicyclobacillus herbarius TaxID=122960 RepID=UPI002352F9C5|nr:oligopeptide/dipeptide ABC transporter ATP-binding protein [Alicyclobacillus herbarius]MCL6632161.1 ATP-binding cassette domain-containing protein [Alicyclobacillus herbarius]